jgi:hypothetical protein
MLGSALRDMALRRKREYAAFIDATTGEQLGPTVSGSADQLELAPLLRAMAPGHKYVCVHVHPDSTSFSVPDAVPDAVLLLRFAAIQAVAAVGLDGTWYVMSLEAPAAPASIDRLAAEVAAARDELSQPYVTLVQAGSLTRREARRALSHEVWVRAAPALGLRYDRVEDTGRSA